MNFEDMSDYLVFISHCGPDTWVARQISQHCLQAGAKTFLDEAQIDVGADFEEEIRDAIDEAAELLVLVTPCALERPYVWLEVGAAWIRRIAIVGVLHGISAAELQAKSGAPVLLKKRNLIDINAIDRYFEELKLRVENSRNTIAS